MAEKTDEERVSIWSTGDTERTWLIALAALFFVSSLALVLWYNWNKITKPDYDAIITVISIIGSIGLSAITLSFFIIEGVNLMIVPVQKIRAETERYLEKRFQDGQRKGHEETIAIIKKMHPDIDIEAIRAALEDQNGNTTNGQ